MEIDTLNNTIYYGEVGGLAERENTFRMKMLESTEENASHNMKGKVLI